MFATYVEGAHVDSHSKNKVEFISGTAVVIPADATLPHRHSDPIVLRRPDDGDL